MSVLDRNVVDFGHEDDYLDYIASGQIYEDFGGSGKTPNIKVIFCHKPTEEVEFILNKIKETIMRGIRISKRLSIPMKNGLY